MIEDTREHELLSVKETAAKLRLHPQTVRRLISEGAIPAVQLAGRGTSIRVDAVELESRLHQASTPAAVTTTSAARSATPSQRGEGRAPQLAGIRSSPGVPDGSGPPTGARPKEAA